MTIIDTQKQTMQSMTVGLIIDVEKKKFVNSNESIPIQFAQNTKGIDVMVGDKETLIKLRKNINRLLTTFP